MAANLMPGRFRIFVLVVVLTGLASSISAQFRLFGPRKAAAPQPMRQASAYISRQEPLKVNQAVLKQATPDNTHIVVSPSKQRAYLMVGDDIVADGPISSGRRGHESPKGHFTVMEKDPNHHSSLYGDFVDS